jgi:hypothetical protein
MVRKHRRKRIVWYGSNFVVYVPHGGGSKARTTVKREYMRWSKTTRQKTNLRKDLKALDKLPAGYYQTTRRNYVGSKKILKRGMRAGKRKFVSKVVKW